MIVDYINQLSNLNFEESFAIVIPFHLYNDDKQYHYCENPISTFYIYEFKNLTYVNNFLIVINHSEQFNEFSFDILNKFNFKKIFTPNKRHILKYFTNSEIYDLKMIQYLYPFESYRESTIEVSYMKIYSEFYDINLNNFIRIYSDKLNELFYYIPLTKHLEIGSTISEKMLNFLYKIETFLKNQSYSLFGVENLPNDIKLYNDAVESLYKLDTIGIMDKNKNMLYSYYNPYTKTGRPSNAFRGINFAALEKNSPERQRIGCRNTFLLSFDYDAYHLRLIGELSGYNFPIDQSAHQYLSSIYGKDRNESKTLTFKYLYGGIPDEISNTIPFFKYAKTLINHLWEQYIKAGYVVSVISNRKLIVDDPTPMKVFNYYIQMIETELNYLTMKKIELYLHNKCSNFVLYIYDNFIIDYSERDGKDFLLDMRNIIELNGKYPTTISVGLNLNEMTKVGS